LMPAVVAVRRFLHDFGDRGTDRFESFPLVLRPIRLVVAAAGRRVHEAEDQGLENAR